MKPKYTVAIRGLNAIDSPGPGVAVARGLKEAASFDVRIIGFSYESLEPGIYMHDLIDKVYQIPYPSAGAKVLKQRLDYINEKESLNLIIPNFDAELNSFMILEKALAEMGVKTFLPTEKQFEERQKINLPEFGKKYDIKVPHSKAIYEMAEIYRLTEEFVYPLLVKGKYYDAYVAYDAEQARNFFNKISAQWGVPIIIQEFVRGNEYNITGLGDGEGNTIAAVPMRKQYITDKGKAWGGITLADEKMMELTRMLIRKTKWKGGMELELIKTNNGEYNLIEINPRIPAWVYLAVGAGQNIPDALIKLALGWDVKPMTEYKIGKMFVRYSYDMIVDLERFAAISMNKEI